MTESKAAERFIVSENEAVMLPVNRIAEKIGLSPDDLEPCGRYTAKVRLRRLPPPGAPPKGKLILVTAITPTAHGEGKTVVSIGLAQAIEKLGGKAIVTLREPSLGPVFGVKGGATGGGRAQVLPAEKINLHFNGDKHAVGAAHNLLAAMLDAHIFHGNELKIDVDQISWPRTMDMNDRTLRRVTIGLGGGAGRLSRESSFIITAASEVMAILGVASDRADFQRRLGAITVGFDRDGRPVHAADLRADGAMMALLNDAIMPNLVQTTEHAPALIHAGPFANIAHGTASVIAQEIALHLADYVVNETGFAADLGAEKFLDIVMPVSGLKPAAALLVVTARGLKHQSGETKNVSFTAGFENLAKHVENLRKFHLPVVAAVNRFPEDTTDDLRVISDFCGRLGVEAAPANVFAEGGQGALELAAMVMKAANGSDLEAIKPLYSPKLALEDKIVTVAKEIYGAGSVEFRDQAEKKIQMFSALGFAHLPVCVAKTQYSLSDDPKKLGAPKDWTLTVTDTLLSSGAGFIVVIAGNMMLMPGLPKSPQATRIGVSEDGTISGLG